jgi:hypothetical protein
MSEVGNPISVEGQVGGKERGKDLIKVAVVELIQRRQHPSALVSIELLLPPQHLLPPLHLVRPALTQSSPLCPVEQVILDAPRKIDVSKDTCGVEKEDGPDGVACETRAEEGEEPVKSGSTGSGHGGPGEGASTRLGFVGCGQGV